MYFVVILRRFRLCCKSLAAFLSNQILSDNSLRLQQQDPPSPHPHARQDTASLLATKTNKKYQPIRDLVEKSCDFVTNQSKCLIDVFVLLKLLKDMFYSDKEYLSVIKGL